MPWHVHRESHILRPKLGLPYHHELPPGIEPFVHNRIVTLVQLAFCSCHHRNVLLLCAECALFSPEIRVESRCRRCFCLRQLFLILLVRSPEVCSQFGQPIRVLHRTPSNWSGFPITRVSTTPACTRCLGVLDMLCICCASLSLLTHDDSGRFDWWCRLRHILPGVRVYLCLDRSALDRFFWVLWRPSRIIQPLSVDNLQVLCSGFLQLDWMGSATSSFLMFASSHTPSVREAGFHSSLRSIYCHSH